MKIENNGHPDFPRYTALLREQDRFLFIANVANSIKKAVPEK